MNNLLKSLVVASLFLQGCAVIHFENGDVVPDPIERSPFEIELLSDWSMGDTAHDQYSEEDSLRYRRWYHHAIFQIAELSNPVELDDVCYGLEWNQVTTESTLTDALFGTIDNLLLINASSAFLDLWTPWSVEYSCRPKTFR